MNLSAFQPGNFECYRCGGEGHAARGCTNPPASLEDRQRIKEEVQSRQQNSREAPNNIATGANSTPIGSGPVGVAAHQAEAEESGEYRDNHDRAFADEWSLGDEDTQIRGSYACELCHSDDDEEWATNEEIYAAGKRSSVEMEPEDQADEEVQQRPVKSRRVAGRSGRAATKRTPTEKGKRPVGWSIGPLDMTSEAGPSNSRDSIPSTIQNSVPLEALPLAPAIK